ncbi:hypothetical protein KAZ01_04055, partial [Candidatus Gracilibacteria bacterium]|nr:hypothetical protein [Candidatus Gracilibacteria bacterium]
FLPNIKNNISFDERKFEIKNIKKDFLLKQWKTVKNFKYNKNISIESFSYGLEEREKIFLNSLGSYKIYKNTFCGHALELYYTYSDFSDVEYESKISSLNQNIDLNFIKNIQEKLLRKSNPEKTKLNNGKYNITFDARLVGEFLNIITNACSGEKIRQNQSMFSIKDLGKNALDDKLTLVTNPSINLSAYNRKFDNEGISTEKLIIIKNGVLENIFLDSKNAKKFKQKPTGNPNFSNLELIGEFSKDYLKTSSFLFTNLMALHTIDMITGKFALQGEGFEIKNGKLGNFIKNVGISGDLKSLFSSIYKLGDNIYTNSNIFTPGITFKNQNIIV